MKSQVSFCKTLKNVNSQVSLVKTKMADRHWTQPVTDVSISAQPDRDLPITTLMLCEVYPDAELNTRALNTLTISSLMAVSTTWGAPTTRYYVESYFTTSPASQMRHQ